MERSPHHHKDIIVQDLLSPPLGPGLPLLVCLERGSPCRYVSWRDLISPTMRGRTPQPITQVPVQSQRIGIWGHFHGSSVRRFLPWRSHALVDAGLRY